MTNPKPALGLPEPENPEPPPVDQNNQTPDTPPILTPEPEPEPEPDERDALMTRQLEMMKRMQARIDELEDRSNRPPAPPPPPEPSVEERNAAFWQNPVNTIREEMDKMIAPLREAVATSTQRDAYSELKDKYRNDKRFKHVFASAESYIDNLMKKQEKTETNLIAVLYGISGAVAVGDIPDITFERPEAPPSDGDLSSKRNKDVLPPHLRPSAPPAPKREGDKGPARALTELEKRLAKENGMTPEEYLELSDLPATMVAFHKPKKEN